MISERFESIGKVMLKSKGKPEFPMFIVPWKMEEMSDDEIREFAESQFPKIIEKITERIAVPK